MSLDVSQTARQLARDRLNSIYSGLRGNTQEIRSPDHHCDSLRPRSYTNNSVYDRTTPKIDSPDLSSTRLSNSGTGMDLVDTSAVALQLLEDVDKPFNFSVNDRSDLDSSKALHCVRLRVEDEAKNLQRVREARQLVQSAALNASKRSTPETRYSRYSPKAPLMLSSRNPTDSLMEELRKEKEALAETRSALYRSRTGSHEAHNYMRIKTWSSGASPINTTAKGGQDLISALEEERRQIAELRAKRSTYR